MHAMQEHTMPPGRPHTGHTGSSGHAYDSEDSWNWTLRQMRSEFRSMPPAAQEAMLDRMTMLLHDEIRRRQNHPSSLMRLVLEVKL